MRPKIMPSHSISDTLLYNERKVTEKQAECILAANFLKDIDRLSFDDKLQRFERRMQLNEDVVTNQHITLNFDPLDQLTNEKMKEIAQVYMKEIGFEHQPYIVYRHHDAGHPHCHIATTHIQRNGEPIVMYNMGRNQSEKARRHIEAAFDLMTKEKKQAIRRQSRNVDGVPMVIYGEKATARAVSDVLEYVVPTYRYTSLEELNAVLRLYNVEAYREGRIQNYTRTAASSIGFSTNMVDTSAFRLKQASSIASPPLPGWRKDLRRTRSRNSSIGITFKPLFIGIYTRNRIAWKSFPIDWAATASASSAPWIKIIISNPLPSSTLKTIASSGRKSWTKDAAGLPCRK